MAMRKPASKRKTPGGDKEAASSDAVVSPHPCREQLVSLTEKDWDALWYASDCSGLDGGAFAMNRLAPGEFRHWFGSEIHAPFQRIFKLLHPECENVFGDVGQRANDKLKAERMKNPNACFVYTSGFPCQPYSRDGARHGQVDPRSQVVYHVMATIEALRPDIFLLENVPDLATDPKFREIFKEIMEILTGIGNECYYVDFRMIDSIDFSVPARRSRVYIVGVLKTVLKFPWSWPKPTPHKDLKSILVPRKPNEKRSLDTLSATALRNLDAAMKKLQSLGKSPKGPWVVDLQNSAKRGLNMTHNHFPTITKSHANSLWLTCKEDYVKPEELLGAQGISKSELAVNIEALPSKALGEMIGNSFTVNVVEAILNELLEAVGFFENL